LTEGSIDKIAKARSCRLGRGLGAGQRHRMDRQGTCEIPHAPTCAICRGRNAGWPRVPGL